MSTNLPLLQPRLLLGLKTNITGNAQYITDDDILYPAGAVLAVHNYNQHKQKFIRLADRGKNVTALVVSPNKEVIAVVESSGDHKPIVTLYCALLYKKKRQITVPPDNETRATNFVAVSFTFDSRCLVCASGEPDWKLYVFKCDKGKLESVTRANNANNTGTIEQIACNPNDVNQIALAGHGLIRILACTNFNWRQYGYSKGDQWNLTCATWLSQDRLICGSIDGRLLVLDSGELKAIFFAGDLPSINLKIKDELQQHSNTSLQGPSMQNLLEGEDYEIRCLVNFPRGFAFAFMHGTVHLYEMETPHKYNKRNVFKIPDRTIVRDHDDDLKTEKMIRINCLSINPSQDQLIVACNQHQIYSIRLWAHELNINQEIMFSENGFALHNGPIGSMAVCSWKPILLTAGANDRYLKIWNYESEELELSQQFQDDLYAAALHPSGLYAIAGFSDKLRFFTIMIDEFVTTREFAIRLCKQCSFSKMGHVFAAANGNVIQVYSSISFEMIYTLKGHSGKIRGMSWMNNDIKLATCGSEGAVYEWSVIDSKRVAETIIKSCQFTGVAITSDGKSVYSVSDDGFVREIINSNVNRDIQILVTGLDAVCLSHIDQMLFVSGNSGTVYNMKLPLMKKAEYVEYNMHENSITQMAISYDDRYLFTSTLDGNICFWKLLNTEGRAIKLSKDFEPSQDILTSRLVLEDKLTQIHNLQLRLHELETEYSYQLRQNDVVHDLRIKDVHAGYCSAIEDLKEKNERLESEHVLEIHNINMDIIKLKNEHDQFIKDLEAGYNEKVIFEYDKFHRLEEKMERMRANYEMELDELKEAKRDNEEELTNDYLGQLHEKQIQYEEIVEEINQKTKIHEEIKQQIEDDADREIYEMKTSHAKELKDEQDLNVQIRGEIAISKKKLLLAQKSIDNLNYNITSLNSEHAKFRGMIIDLEKDVADLKKEITERDTTIKEKEKRIFDLKRKNQELEKYKFILDFKIVELKSMIEPKERRIQEQNEQINEMVHELENLQRVILSLDLQLNELKEKLVASKFEVRTEVSRNAALKRALKKIRSDIFEASTYIQDLPKLTKAIKDMYHQYNADEDFALIRSEEYEMKSEFLRQRDFLERTVSTLQSQVYKGSSTLGQDKTKLVDENATLLIETNTLRKSLKSEQTKRSKLQTILGFNSKFMLPRVAEERITKATSTRNEIHKKYEEQIKENEKTIEALKVENNRLLEKIFDQISQTDDQPADNEEKKDDENGNNSLL